MNHFDKDTREQLTAFVLALTFGFGLLLLVFLTSGCEGTPEGRDRSDSAYNPDACIRTCRRLGTERLVYAHMVGCYCILSDQPVTIAPVPQ